MDGTSHLQGETMNLLRLLFAGAICCALAACTSDRPLEGIPLVWMPKATVAATGAVDTMGFAGHGVTIEPFEDRRPNPQLIGENREQREPRLVTTSDNVAAFVTREMKDLLSRSGVDVVKDGGLILRGEVISFFVTETNTYNGDVQVKLTLQTPAGKVLWQGLVGGAARHFGRSYREENYYETLSDSLVHLAANLLHDPDFRKAVSGS